MVIWLGSWLFQLSTRHLFQERQVHSWIHRFRGGAALHNCSVTWLCKAAQLRRKVKMMSLYRLLAALPFLLLLCQQCSCKGVLYYQEPEGNMDGTCSGQPNTIKPWVGEPALKTQTINGSLYSAGEGDDEIYGKLCTASMTMFD